MTPIRTLSALPALLAAAPAAAHPGHIAGAMGHDHWIGLAAIGGAIAVAVWAGLRARKARGAESAADEGGEPSDEEAQEA
jgi:hypothetical protein